MTDNALTALNEKLDRLIEAVTRRRGFDPDKPRNLNKVTVTV